MPTVLCTVRHMYDNGYGSDKLMVFSLQNLSDSTSGNRNVQNDLRNVKEYGLLHYASLFRNLQATI